MQENPNKSKEKSLFFLGFLWPIQGFSMGYARKKSKIPPRSYSLPGLCSESFGARANEPVATPRRKVSLILPPGI
jgi:hypothetical protein